MTVDIQTLSNDYVVVDLDTGTVLGTNLVAVPARNLDFTQSDFSDSEIVEIAKKFSLPLKAEVLKFY